MAEVGIEGREMYDKPMGMAVCEKHCGQMGQ